MLCAHLLSRRHNICATTSHAIITTQTQVESILKPVRGIRDAQRRAGITPTNHSRHNIQAVKEQSRLNALQKTQQQDERIIQHSSSRKSLTPSTARQHQQQQYQQYQYQQPSRSSSLASSGGGGADTSAARDFVEENKVAAVAAAARRPVKAEARAGAGPGEYLQKAEYGQVRVCGLIGWLGGGWVGERGRGMAGGDVEAELTVAWAGGWVVGLS